MPKTETPEEVQEAIRDLLDLCTKKDVEVPKELRKALRRALKEKAPDPPGRTPFAERVTSEKADILEHFTDDILVQQAYKLYEKLKQKSPDLTLRVKEGNFKVTDYYDETSVENTEGGDKKRTKQKISTVYNSSPSYAIIDKLKRTIRTGRLCNKLTEDVRLVMKGVNLYFEAGKTYLVLGAPRSGKSTLLKLIAGILPEDRDHLPGGTVSLNAFNTKTKDVVWSNYVGYVDQIDRLHAFLTVKETCEFAWRCRSGGTHRNPTIGEGEEVDEEIKKMDAGLHSVFTVLQGMGLKRVADTFVGDQQTVRGVSGGEKKRVTVAEMAVATFPVACADEISTGLDAATTYDVCKLMGDMNRLQKFIKIVSLLQPPPETFALFDELILLSQGLIIYSGPVEKVVAHFQSLGYRLPDRMDVADWLQAIPTKDGNTFLQNGEGENTQHLTSEEFSSKFYESELGQNILAKLGSDIKSPVNENDALKVWMQEKNRNNWFGSLKLLISREMLLWWRDKTQIKARLAQDLVMGIISGTLFWQGSDEATSVMGIMFQSMFFVSIGAMLKIGPQYEVRGMLYKHQDANFFPTWTYVAGRSLAGLPSSIMDGVVYGTLIYWLVGLAHDEGATVANYFIFVLLITVASVTIGLVFSVFSGITRDRSTGQAIMSVLIVVLVLFSGYAVQPDVIPNYWLWVYWMNIFAWALRGLAVNEFDSGKYNGPSAIPGKTEGEVILERFGFYDGNGNAYTSEWAWWALLYCLGVCIMAVIVSSISLVVVRFATGRSLATDSGEDEEETDPPEQVELPFQKVNLTFRNIQYTVTASVGKEKIVLLKGIDGVVEAGKMIALMGSSGAGKTTLMDVLALRKNSGDIVGDVRLNGHPQEEFSFRRCTGYVEQFDVQSSQLTIRETCEFSAKLRLESSSPEVTPESTKKFVDQTLYMLELTDIQDLQVGSDDSGGLSFEQRKRLSIAVELVANPSIIFLDEPTSGLDARAASIVMRGLKRIASSGRAVCATIHQPSIAIFNSFDALLLLKRGGETVFFGDLGHESVSLINYLEQYEATPKIQPGENPATWMLTSIGAGSASTDAKPFDYAGYYQVSDLHKSCLKRIEESSGAACEEGIIAFPSKYATSKSTQIFEVMARARTIFWRSPSYNMVRMLISAVLSLLIGSVYVSSRTPHNESDMSSRATTIFTSFLFMGVNSLNTVLSLFEAERNMYYRHKAALMYDKTAILVAFTTAELPFIILSSLVFVSIFYFMLGFAADAAKFFLFYFFFMMTMGCFTFLGQMFVALTRDADTAQGFGGLVVSLSALFTGVLIRPENIPKFWIFMYWLMPGHYIFEGLIVSQFDGDQTPITASPGTPFWEFLKCDDKIAEGATTCVGTAEQWVFASFQGNFLPEHLPADIIYLVCLFVLTRVVTGYALGALNYRST